MKSIRSIELHAAISLHGTKILGSNTIVSDKYPKVKMEEAPNGIIVTDDGSDGKGPRCMLVPWPNVKQVIYDVEKANVAKKAS
jgi:hypothetical protein